MLVISLLYLFRPDLAKSCVLPELVELANDEESTVRVAALETIGAVIPHMTQETVRTSVIPLMQSSCQQALSSGSSSLTGVAGLLGKLSHQMRGNDIVMFTLM